MTRSAQTDTVGGTKRRWVKPAVRHLKAGAAEFNSGTNEDGDPGTANNNS